MRKILFSLFISAPHHIPPHPTLSHMIRVQMSNVYVTFPPRPSQHAFRADSDIPEGVEGEEDSGELLLGYDHLWLLDVPLRGGHLHSVW